MWDYTVREKVKATYRPLMDDTSLPMSCRKHAASQVLCAWYYRSVEAYVRQCVKPEQATEAAHVTHHPGVAEYCAMMLNHGHEVIGFPEDVYDEMVRKYGKKPGIPVGETYFPK